MVGVSAPAAARRCVVAYVLLIGLLMGAAWSISVSPGGRNLVMQLALLWWCVALLWVALAPRRVTAWSAALAGVLALVPAWLALLRLRVGLADGAQWVLFAFLLVWVADIGAYFCRAAASAACTSRRRFPRPRPGKGCSAGCS